MKKGLILWDIDGTLLKRVDKEVISIHIEALYGEKKHPAHSTELTGLTDWEVLNYYEEDTERVRVAFAQLDKIQEAQSFDHFVPLVGINDELFRELTPNWIHGILTGNSWRRAIFKIKSVSLLEHFNQKYFFVCKEGDARPDILNRALENIDSDIGTKVIIGDTVNDIRTAKMFDLPVVSTATGKFNFKELSNHKPNLTVSNLADGKSELHAFLSSLAM
jgi:phosphoglycolate phosphatase-like HAD superfamily hydrolase